MATSILSQGTPSPNPDHYTIKEFQLLVRDTPVVPAEIQPFVGSSGKWGGGTWFGAFRIPNLVPRSLVNIVG